MTTSTLTAGLIIVVLEVSAAFILGGPTGSNWEGVETETGAATVV